MITMKIIRENRRVRFDYTVLDTYTAGIILKGPEVKEIKAGKIDISRSYCRMKPDGLYLWNALISSSVYGDIDDDREKKLLLHKKELTLLTRGLEQKGQTAVPLSVGLERGLIKIRLALVKGKRLYDKRQTEKKRDTDRMLRQLRQK